MVRVRRSAQMLCVSCHLDPATHTLAGRPLADMPPALGALRSSNITQDWRYGIGAWTDGELAYVLRTGVARDGRYTPPWMPKFPLLADDEMRDVIAFLRSDDPLVRATAVPAPPSAPTFLAKALARVAYAPLPYPARPIPLPPRANTVAYGRYLATAKLACHRCHSRDYAEVNALEPERSGGFMGGGYAMTDRMGLTVVSSNLTPDPGTGLGSWTEEQFRRALTQGLRPDGRALRRPMVPRPELDADEVHAIWSYLRTLPPLLSPLPPAEPLAAGGR